MKLSTSIVSAIALTALLYKNFVTADLVSVEGDGTFDITGPVYSEPGTISTSFGSACPQIGDTAVDECHPYNPSYDAKSGKCVAPVPAACKPVKGGVWGCVWDLSGLAPADDVTTVPMVGDCQDVSVEGDGMFCIEGMICSGSGAEPAGSTCPQVGDTVVGDCYSYLPSYDAKTGKCVAPVPSLCKPVKTGVWGCVWDLSDVAPAFADDGLEDVQVVSDGVYRAKGSVCGGPTAAQTGTTCRQIGDVAMSSCTSVNPSYDTKSANASRRCQRCVNRPKTSPGTCVAPASALCQPTQNNTIWGCVWDLSDVATITRLATVSTTTENDSPSEGVSGDAIVGLATGVTGVAAVVAVVAVAALNKRKSKAQTIVMCELELSSRKALASLLSSHFHDTRSRRTSCKAAFFCISEPNV